MKGGPPFRRVDLIRVDQIRVDEGWTTLPKGGPNKGGSNKGGPPFRRVDDSRIINNIYK
jgi:hypothetical protein